MMVSIFVWTDNSFWITVDNSFQPMSNKIEDVSKPDKNIELEPEKWHAY